MMLAMNLNIIHGKMKKIIAWIVLIAFATPVVAIFGLSIITVIFLILKNWEVCFILIFALIAFPAIGWAWKTIKGNR